LRASGLLDGNLPPDFAVPEPTDVAALMPDEVPLDDIEEEDAAAEAAAAEAEAAVEAAAEAAAEADVEGGDEGADLPADEDADKS
jgi:segregation and condensation protein B